MPFAREAFATLGETRIKDGRAISAADVRDADLLAIRSTTRVNRALLEGSSVKFVGTATIGTDHMDTAWLDNAGIRWCYAPGCNANSVAEYVVSALLCLSVRHGFPLAGKTLGIVGVGNVGSRVMEKARALGLRVLPNDPPRQRAEAAPAPSDPAFVPLEQVLAESDIVTLHVPLTHEGPDKTFHMADRRFFDALKPGCVFLNSARGAVVNTDDLLRAMDKNIVAHAVIDTWEGEPAYRSDLLARVDLGTPHIAGYSFDGKVMGTVRVYREACRFLGLQSTWTPDALLPSPPVPEVVMDAAGRADEAALWTLVRHVYDVETDDRVLRRGDDKGDKTRAAHFDRLRKQYPMRREFRFTSVRAPGAPDSLRKTIATLGFALSS